jgi:hypothetical protein
MAISEELKRRGVAASTIKEALGDYVTTEPLRIINKMCLAASYVELQNVQADAKAYNVLRKELDAAISAASID